MKNKNLRKNKISVFSAVCFIVLSLYCLFLIVLIVWGLFKSFQDVEDYVWSGLSASAFPKQFTIDNYVSAFSMIKYVPSVGRTIFLPEMLFNSVFYAVGSSCVSVMTNCLVAYITTKYNNKFNAVVEGIFYFVLLVPIQSVLGSTIQLTKFLGLYDTWTGMFIFKLNFLGSFLIFKATFKTLDNGYAEAATIDGAGHYTILFRIILPLIRSIIMILFVTSFIGCWNDYQTPMVYLPSHMTASYGMFLYNKATSSYQDYIIYKMAGFMILLIPTFILFMFMKDKMIGNLTIGGLKG